jgi:hypothetical protein
MKEEEGANHQHQDHIARQEDVEEPLPADLSPSEIKKGRFNQD